jgi:hypothetical protein
VTDETETTDPEPTCNCDCAEFNDHDECGEECAG